MRLRGALAITIAGALGLAAPAVAQTKKDAPLAQALFDEARALLEKGDVNAACPRLAESQRLDPATGTLLNLADCYERQGKTASAWSRFLEAAEQARTAKQTSRETKARARAQALETKLVRLTIEVPASSRTTGLVITRDGEVVSEAAWNVAVPVDPGSHAIAAHAPNHRDFSLMMTVSGGSSTLEIPPLAELTAPPSASASAAAPPVMPAVPSSPPSTSAAPLPAPTAREDGSTQRTWAYVAGGVGLTALIVGSVFGLVAHAKNQDSLADCVRGDKDACTADGKSLRDGARSAGDVSTAAFVIGLAGLGTSAALFLTAPTSNTGVALGPGSVSLRGTF